MKSLAAVSVIVLLVGCEYSHIDRTAAKPVRELHYNLATGQQVGIKTLTYDKAGNLLSESFDADPRLARTYQLTYEYDVESRLTRKTFKYDNSIADIVDFKYHDGLLVEERDHQENDVGVKKVYFYTFARIDSVWEMGYYKEAQEFVKGRTLKYTYDQNDRLISDGDLMYTYDSHGRILKECTQSDVSISCGVINTYDSEGKKILVKSSTAMGEGLEEELFYNGDILVEKRVWDYPYYGRLDMPVVTKIVYEY